MKSVTEKLNKMSNYLLIFDGEDKGSDTLLSICVYQSWYCASSEHLINNSFFQNYYSPMYRLKSPLLYSN